MAYELYKKRIEEAAQSKKSVRIYYHNGYQVTGVPTGRFDDQCFEFGTNLVSFAAITTMTSPFTPK